MATPRPRKKPKAKTACCPKTPPTFRGFIHVNEAVASRAEPYKLPPELAQIYTDRLFLDDSQREAVLLIYARNQLFCQKFDSADEHSQLTACAILATNHLDTGALDELGNKWSCRWSSSEGVREKATQRLLYQCYSHAAHGSSKRSNPIDFTGCLAHCEIVYQVTTYRVLVICGHLEHNDESLSGAFACPPVFPVHPSVYKHALQLLKDVVTLADVKKTNQQMFAEQKYRDMPDDLANSRFQWLLSHKDNRSLY
ncbi:hypothetical protein BC835DRAFT_1308474 [Cytidiella melzeri]|nr:hypothetical protein BC835DRAFT_1308474 [Cytidiella melzeri]